MSRPTLHGTPDERTRMAVQAIYDRTPSEWEAVDANLETHPVERAGDEEEDSADRMITVPDEGPDPIQEKINMDYKGDATLLKDLLRCLVRGRRKQA